MDIVSVIFVMEGVAAIIFIIRTTMKCIGAKCQP